MRNAKHSLQSGLTQLCPLTRQRQPRFYAPKWQNKAPPNLYVCTYACTLYVFICSLPPMPAMPTMPPPVLLTYKCRTGIFAPIFFFLLMTFPFAFVQKQYANDFSSFCEKCRISARLALFSRQIMALLSIWECKLNLWLWLVLTHAKVKMEQDLILSLLCRNMVESVCKEAVQRLIFDKAWLTKIER